MATKSACAASTVFFRYISPALNTIATQNASRKFLFLQSLDALHGPGRIQTKLEECQSN